MRKFVSLLGIAAVAGLFLALSPNPITAKPVQATTCTGLNWFIDRYGNVASTHVYDYTQLKYTYVNAQTQLRAAQDSCGIIRQWQTVLHMWIDDGTCATWYVHLRLAFQGDPVFYQIYNGSPTGCNFYVGTPVQNVCVGLGDPLCGVQAWGDDWFNSYSYYLNGNLSPRSANEYSTT